MHQFLKSIGFSSLNKKSEIDELLQEVISNPTGRVTVEREDGSVFVELSLEFGNFFGIGVRGEYDENNKFQTEYYFPYYCGSCMSTRESVDIERHSDKESYAGVCDEVKIGVTMIFFLQNALEYLNLKKVGRINHQNVSTSLSALSSRGTVLFPISKDEKQIQDNKKLSSDRSHLIAAARDGDEEAIENLTLEDIDTYSMLSRRVMYEDILTIVDTYFMPYGIESEQYSVLGEIMDFEITENSYTGEQVCLLTLSCNNLEFGVSINRNDLVGELAVGRRFKGIVWMQGCVQFPEM